MLIKSTVFAVQSDCQGKHRMMHQGSEQDRALIVEQM